MTLRPIDAAVPTFESIMGGRRRSRMDICFELMEHIWTLGEVRPTQLMYKANLSWRSLNELLLYLSDRGLVKSNTIGARRTISITDLGRSCLKGLYDARSILMPAASDATDEIGSSVKVFPTSQADGGSGTAEGQEW